MASVRAIAIRREAAEKAIGEAAEFFGAFYNITVEAPALLPRAGAEYVMMQQLEYHAALLTAIKNGLAEIRPDAKTKGSKKA